MQSASAARYPGVVSAVVGGVVSRVTLADDVSLSMMDEHDHHTQNLVEFGEAADSGHLGTDLACTRCTMADR